MGTAAQQEAQSQQQPLRVDVTLDEIEKGAKAADVEAATQKAADDAKKAAEAAAQPDPKVTALTEALRLSEESRRRLEADLGTRAAPAALVEPAKAKEYTAEELDKLYQEKPLEAIAYLTQRAASTVEENISRRLSPLVAGSASSAEAMARAKYPDEFVLFGDQLKTFVANAKDPAVFSVPKNWDDLISWMRGKSENFDMLIAHRAKREKDKATIDAQAAQAALAGAHVRSDTRSATPKSEGGLDETERAIVKELARSGVLTGDDPEAEYRKWRSVGR